MPLHTGMQSIDDMMADFITYSPTPYDETSSEYLTVLQGNSWMTKSPFSGSPLILPQQGILRASPTLTSTSEASVTPEPTVLDFDLEGPAEKLQTGRRQSRTPKLRQGILTGSTRNGSLSSTLSDDTESTGDPHHEGSCAKCRMTEAEARKCRLERRREQNRASQRKFRARKEAKIREAASQVATLETYVDFLERHNGDLEATNAELRAQLEALKKSTVPISLPSDGLAHAQSAPPCVSGSGDAVGRPRSPIHSLYLPLFDHELQPPFR